MCFVLIRIFLRDLSTEETLLFCSNFSSKLCLNCPSLPSHFTPPWLPWELRNKAQSLHWMFWTPYPLAYFTFTQHKHSGTLSVKCVSLLHIFPFFFCVPLILVWWCDCWGEQVRTRGEESDDLSCVSRKDTAARWHGGRNHPPFVLSSVALSADLTICYRSNFSFSPVSHEVTTHWSSPSFYILLPSCNSFCF